MTASGAPPATSPRGGPSPVAVVALFVLSGAAGLIYEVVWARQLVLVFGNTSQAVSAILTGFFGGMAIGSVLGGRVADRVRSPLRLYGLLELVLVVVVVLTPITFTLIREVYRGFYGALETAPEALALVRFGLSLLALGPATILMGATLPALTRELTRPPAHLSRAFGWLYAANTVGAILGTLAAGLVLIELFGLSGALLVGATCSAAGGRARAAARSPTSGGRRLAGPRRRGSLRPPARSSPPLVARRPPIGPARPRGRLRRRASSRSATRCSGRGCSRPARATRPTSSR